MPWAGAWLLLWVSGEASLTLDSWQLAPHTWKAISAGFVEKSICASWRLLPAASNFLPLLRGSPPGASLAYVVLGVCRPDASLSAAQIAPEKENVIGRSQRVTASWFPSTIQKACAPWGWYRKMFAIVVLGG